jgi:hypothetical protein
MSDVRCSFATGEDLDAYLLDPRRDEFTSFRRHWPTCPECSARVMRGSQVEEALRSIGLESAGGHPAEPVLLVFSDDPGRLAPALRKEVARHLAACRTCADEVRALTAFDSTRVVDARERFALRVPRSALAAAAALLLAALGTTLWLLRSSPSHDTTALAPPAFIAQQEPRVAPPPPPPAPATPSRVVETPVPVAKPPIAEAPPKLAAPERATTPNAPAAHREVAKKAIATPAPIVVAANDPSLLPRYAPPLGAGSGMRRLGGAVRGGSDEPTVLVLAPDHVGRTASASPTLYFFLDRDVDAPIEISVVDPNAIEPLAELTFSPPRTAGIHAVPLAGRGVALKPGVVYRWSAAIVRDAESRSGDVVASGAIERSGAAPKPANADTLAQAGFFYDALAAVSGEIDAHPGDARYRARRAALLEQVGLAKVAAFDRR